ncbi:L-alanine-DL-glutamate epimerase-like enolase superfamily enzyme [Prosthecobacter fusiformis]|uniref:L-alanine-DL-glutamate epimerase-like enolase superfamily enzyme n=1 Tax=Prosthecobacter fusiformis TaxID=48464 RepID=A0A4R7S5J5_9BACT|nr:enolase C-terminal domain-like protein [Prosthecobacter fusiformis]TDU72808.1 L-alanine-DL-glutamate epimerase-like enolase superfamily enzyme [Prosthecobacter fusiformis]
MPEVELKTLHLTEPFRIAHGSSSTRQVVRVHGNGAIGEAPFVPYYGESPEATVTWLNGTHDQPGTRSGSLALDLWHLDQTRVPMWQSVEKILGPGKPWEQIYACRSLGIPTDLAAFAERVRETARQFRVLKLKLGSGDLDHDTAIVVTARDAAPHATLFADVNGGWSVDQTVQMLGRLSPHGLVLLEQPVHHHLGIEAWVELKAKAPAHSLPLYADESAQNAADVSLLAGLVQGVNVKLLKCGHFGGGIEMIATARQHGLGVILGCMIESSLGTTAAAHLAPWADYVDLDGHLYLADDDYTGITFDGEGRVVMPQGCGIGARPRT